MRISQKLFRSNMLRSLRVVIWPVQNVDPEDRLTQTLNNMQTPLLHQRHVLGHKLLGSTHHKDHIKICQYLLPTTIPIAPIFTIKIFVIIQLKLFINNIEKAIPLQAWTGPEDSRRLRLPDFKTIGT